MGNEKWPVPRGIAATKAKNKYRNNNYDRIELAVPKGMKEKINMAAKNRGISKTAYIVEAVNEKFERENQFRDNVPDEKEK